MALKRLTLSAVGCVATCLISGCAIFEGSTDGRKLSELNDRGMLVAYDATRRGQLVLPENYKGKVLSEQPPDAVMSSTLEFLAKTTGGKVDAEASVKLAQAVTELGKVTTGVKFLREALFRLNEATVNGTVKSESEYLAAMREIIKWSVEAERTRQVEATATIVRSLADSGAIAPEDAKAILRSLPTLEAPPRAPEVPRTPK